MQIRRSVQRAYTLIELMTVMAITAILLTIIVYPVFQVFGFTRQAQAFSDTQFHAKSIADRIAEEIAGNAGVRDTSRNHAHFQIDVADSGGAILAPSVDVPMNSLVAVVPGKVDTLENTTPTPWLAGWSGSKATPAVLGNAQIDIWKAAQDGDTSGGGYINPKTGKVDPTLTEPKGQVQLPVAPGRTLIRYAVTLRDPLSPYNNMYDGVLMKPLGGRDNLYVLRRFEIPTYLQVTDPADGKSYPVVNKLAFIDLSRLTDAHKSRLRVGAGNGPLYDDPFFMDPNHSLEGVDASGKLTWASANPLVAYDTDVATGRVHHDKSADPTKQEMITYWLKHSTIVTELSRYDMITAEYDRRTKAVEYDGNAPRIFPLVQFKPTRVSSEPAVGQTAVRNGQETDNAGLIGPEVYRTEKGMWSNPVVRVYPSGWQNPTCSTSTTDANESIHRYSIARQDPAGARDGLSIYVYDPAMETCAEATSGIEVFDLGVYNQGGQYPFTAALTAANSRSSWASGSVAVQNSVRSLFEGFNVFNGQGYIRSSFDISEMGTANPPTPDTDVLPRGHITNVSTPATDSTSSDPVTHPYAGTAYDINACFNRMWNDPVTSFLRPDIHRFLDLRVTRQNDGTFGVNDGSQGPLDPGIGFAKANIVPGSEDVWGPDQNPGVNYGTMVRYYRVTKNPGPNQYRINYTDQTEPTDYTALGFAHNPPATYDPADFISAVIQPRFKRGYMQFNSDPNNPLPAGTITVKYRFQFTMPGDVVAVDYDTREVMNVLVTVKSFPQSSLSQAQTVTIPATAKVRYVLK